MSLIKKSLSKKLRPGLKLNDFKQIQILSKGNLGNV